MGKYTTKNSTGDAGEFLTGYAFAGKLGWAYRILDSDTGIDGEVEIFDGQQATGRILKVQVKSTVKPRHVRPEDVDADAAVATPVTGGFNISIKKTDVAYWQLLTLPVVVCVADIGAAKVYFKAIDGSVDIPEGKEKTFSVFVPSENEVGETGRAALLAVVSAAANPFGRFMNEGDAKLKEMMAQTGDAYAHDKGLALRARKDWFRRWNWGITSLVTSGRWVLSDKEDEDWKGLNKALNRRISELDIESRDIEYN